jgi:DNA-directed RNA polymerase subunit L
MEVKIVENKKGKLKFEVYGADHGLMNLLREELAEDKNVEFSTYSTPHPLLDGFVVTVMGKDPQASTKKAMSAMKSYSKDVLAAFKKAK